MALTAEPRRLVQTLLTSSQTPVFTNTSVKQIIKEFIFSDVGSSNTDIYVYIRPAGETLSGKHQLYYIPLNKNDTITLTGLDVVMETSDDLIITSNGTTSCYISGCEWTIIP